MMAYDHSSFLTPSFDEHTTRSNLAALQSLNSELYFSRQIGDLASALGAAAPMQVDAPGMVV